MRKRSEWCVIDGCPFPASIAPYVYLVTRKAKQTVSSGYRGEDPVAVRILHKYGKHTQAEIHREQPAISNPKGFSQHELKSDGVANPNVLRGGDLDEWEIGVDSGTDSESDKRAVRNAAAHYGWKVRHPYSRGVEGHHWCFATQPHPNSRIHAAHISLIRTRLRWRG